MIDKESAIIYKAREIAALTKQIVEHRRLFPEPREQSRRAEFKTLTARRALAEDSLKKQARELDAA